MSSRPLRCTAAIGLVATLAGCSSFAPPPAPPKLRTEAIDQVGPRLTNYGTAVLMPGAVVTVWGDDFTGPSPDAPHPKGKTITLATALASASGLKVIDHASPGQTAAEGLAQLTAADAGALVVICYGYGDASRQTKDFQPSLDAMIRLAHSRGAPVLLVTEPPLAPPPAPAPLLPGAPPRVPTAKEKQLQAFVAQVSALQDIVRTEAPAAGAGLVDSTPVLSPPAASPKVAPPNILTPAEKQPGALLGTERIAHAVAGLIELAR